MEIEMQIETVYAFRNGQQTDQIIGFDLTEVPEKPTNAQADEAMRQISAALGRQLGVVKISGYWLIGDMRDGWIPIYGHKPGQQTRKFDLVLSRGLNTSISRMVNTLNVPWNDLIRKEK